MKYHAEVVDREIDSGEVGWCHQCGTLQLFTEAPWLEIPYWRDEVHPCCIVCGDSEPWEMGVFPMPDELHNCARLLHVTWSPPACETCAADGWDDGCGPEGAAPPHERPSAARERTARPGAAAKCECPSCGHESRCTCDQVLRQAAPCVCVWCADP